MKKGIKGYNSEKDKPDIEPDGLQTWDRTKKITLALGKDKPEFGVEIEQQISKINRLVEYFKNLYLRAMLDLDLVGAITFHDRELIDWSVGEGKPFASFYALGDFYGFTAPEISNIRSGVRKMKTKRVRAMINKLETIKRES